MTLTDLLLERYYDQNVGTADRVLRIATLPLALGVWAAGLVTGPLAVLAIATGALFAKTGATGKCVVYYNLGLSTAPKSA